MWMSYSRELYQVDSPCSAKQGMCFKALLYILESYRLEKTFKIIESNHQADLLSTITKPRLSATSTFLNRIIE